MPRLISYNDTCKHAATIKYLNQQNAQIKLEEAFYKFSCIPLKRTVLSNFWDIFLKYPTISLMHLIEIKLVIIFF